MVVSAAVLVLVVLGVLAGMDAVSGTAAANQARTVAAALAEQDQERLRGMRTEDLKQLSTIQPLPRGVKIGAVTYTVASEARWVTDASDEDVSCSLTPDQGSYLRITSTVTSPITGAKVKPVKVTSIVAPQPGKGTLTALVKNAAGQPVAGFDVSVTGPTSGGPIKTNAAGCAVFTDRDAGSYQVTLNTAGWVDASSSMPTQKRSIVSAGNLSTVDFVIDRAASFNVKVETVNGSGARVSDLSSGVMAAHTEMKPSGLKLIAPATPTATFAFTNMFPFTTPYRLYSGRCTGNDPSNLPGNASYFTSHPGAVVQLAPSQIAGTKTVIEPRINARVTWDGSVRSDARVYLYPKAEGCELPNAIDLGTTTGTAASGQGNLANVVGHPFGTYDLCATYNPSGTNNARFLVVENVLNNADAGRVVTIPLRTSSPQSPLGSCSTTGDATP